MQLNKIEKKYKDNPNPNANIGFIICYPFQFYVYKNIYKYLNNSEFIIDLGIFFPKQQPSRLVEDVVSFLRAKNVNYRILYYHDYYYNKYLEDFFSKYNTLVSLWERGCINFACNLDKKKVNLTYGAGKELTQVRVSRRIYDLILTFGKRDYKLFSTYTKAEIVGNPKFDDWFNNDLDLIFLDELEKQLSREKKTILYLPTHGDLSSIRELKKELGKLAAEFNIIAKIHYFTVREESELIDELKSYGIVVYSDEADLLPMLKISDVVISDNSSAIFDAILADKPMLVTAFLSDEYLDTEHKKPRTYIRGRRGALTYSGSIEQEIKKKKLVPSIKSASELRLAIEKAIEGDVFYRKARKDIREEIFAFNDGQSGKRAADAIEKISQSKKTYEHPIMFHVIEAYLNEIQQPRRSVVARNMNYRKMKNYEDMISKKIAFEGIIFSVILINLEESFLEASLLSLVYQKFNRENFEIFIVSSNKKNIEKTMDSMRFKEISLPVIKIIEIKENEMGFGIQKALLGSQGKIICFTKDECITISDWLVSIFDAYQKNPSVAGVGGFSVCKEENYSLLDEFDNLDIARKLGVWKEGNYISKLYEVRNRRFNQNPAGSFANMSYQRDIIIEHKHLFDRRALELIELNVKDSILIDRSKELCFIPIPTIKQKKQTFRSFLHNNFFCGFVYAHFLKNKSNKNFFNKNSFIAPFRNAAINLIDGNSHKKLVASSIIFIGYFYRWLGDLYFRILSLSLWLRGNLKRIKSRSD
jgi:CDP-glycerol glycerophosphotransferase (TagB/SpsB family)